MTTSFTFSESASFTVTHARHMAAKVATDLKRMQRLYGAPSDLSLVSQDDGSFLKTNIPYHLEFIGKRKKAGSWMR